MPPSSALPLKVTPASTPAKPTSITGPTRDKTSTSSAGSLKPGDISSPHELTAFVETLLEQLDVKFDEMSSQILDRMGQMSTRVDALEASIQDIINGDMTATPSVPQSPLPAAAPAIKRSGSALQ
jgi:heat shock factor-binding protein 1